MRYEHHDSVVDSGTHSYLTTAFLSELAK